MPVQYYVASSLDGYLADSEGKLDWLLQFGFDSFQEHYDRFLERVGALVMGARTYEFLLGLPNQAWEYGDRPTWIVTTRELPRIPGAALTFTADVAGAVQDARAAAGDDNVWVVGGGAVAAQLADLELIDELHLTYVPVVLGSGTPLLPLTQPTRPLALLGSTVFENGAVEVVYSFHAAG
jgi:dihydrofolate reductase